MRPRCWPSPAWRPPPSPAAAADTGCSARSAPRPALRTALGYLPGALFVSYVAPALVAGGAMQWVGAAATVALMARTGNLSVAILGGTAVAWAWWSAA